MSADKNKSLFDIKNYNKKLNISDDVILKKFNEIINEYLLHLIDNIVLKIIIIQILFPIERIKTLFLYSQYFIIIYKKFRFNCLSTL